MKGINDFFGPSAEKRRVDGKYIMYLRIMINRGCAALKRTILPQLCKVLRLSVHIINKHKIDRSLSARLPFCFY